MAYALHQISFRSSYKTNVSVIIAGDKRKPAILLLHGFASSAHTFRDVIPILAKSSYVIAPDLPGFGASDMLPVTSFDAFTTVISELLDHLRVKQRFIYLHDYGAPVGLQIAMQAPEQVLGLIVQNANAHHSGFGPEWKDTLAFWDNPTPENEAAATAHLTFEGIRDQYIANVPEDVAVHISPSVWEEDWRVMSLPGRLAMHRDLNADYASHAAQFGTIAKYLKKHQPPALMVWGRHDAFFDIAEIVSWMKDLPRMEAHILDGGHFLLETHAAATATLLQDFITTAQK